MMEEGDVLWVASDDDVYIFLDGDTAWGDEVLYDSIRFLVRHCLNGRLC
jgi:hypothetical protein